jgi:hypothetical protein
VFFRLWKIGSLVEEIVRLKKIFRFWENLSFGPGKFVLGKSVRFGKNCNV